MQPIQDKEFDKLFRDGLHDVEIEPSQGLWSSIEAEITPKKKAYSLRYWLVAASMLLFAGVTLVVYKQQSDTMPSKSANVISASSRPGKVAEVLPKVVKRDEALLKDLPLVENGNSMVVTRKSQSRKLLVKIAASVPLEKMDGGSQESENNTLPKILTSLPTEIVIASATKPLQENIVLAAVEKPQETAIAAEDTSPAKGIKSAGDLINLVVGAVDRGKNKFIRFKTNDEGSTLAAVNIGPFRFGKRND